MAKLQPDPDPYPSRRMRARPSHAIDLSDWPTLIPPVYASKQDYKAQLADHTVRLAALQDLLFATADSAVLIVFQAMDAAGKDGAIKHVMSGVNPQGCDVFSFGPPTRHEVKHDFLWRAARVLPPRGKIGIFNRSYYEEVLIAKVEKPDSTDNESSEPEVRTAKFWHQRYRSIKDFEAHLAANRTVIVKIFLHVSKEEQRKRLLERIDDLAKNWKITSADIRSRHLWKDYQRAYEECLSATTTDTAPWHIVPADDKQTARLLVSQIVLEAMQALDLKLPKPSAARLAELAKLREGLA